MWRWSYSSILRGWLHLVVDYTLLSKHGKHVYGLGWFRDAAASTPKRTVISSGNHWVVMGLAIRIPGTNKIFCLPIHAKLHISGKGQPGEATLARQMLDDVLAWFPERKLVFIGDGAYSAKYLLGNLNPRVTHVGVMRGDAALYGPHPPKQRKANAGRSRVKVLACPARARPSKRRIAVRAGRGFGERSRPRHTA